MPYEFDQGKMYRMPTHFGPSLGPRQGPKGRVYENVDSPARLSLSVSFLTDAEALSQLLPPRFELDGDPLVNVAVSYITGIEWLAGRGYNTLGVTCPAVFHGKNGDTAGNYLMVLWENLADPIITGREELGYPKVYSEIDPPRYVDDRVTCSAHWLGCQFFEMILDQGSPIDGDGLRAIAENQRGVLTYKYMPRTQEWYQPDAEYVTFTPPIDAAKYLREAWVAEGSVSFRESTWEELPTLCNVVNALSALPIREWRSSDVRKTIGGTDYRVQQILE